VDFKEGKEAHGHDCHLANRRKDDRYPMMDYSIWRTTTVTNRG
jgi:hypothetical protein